MAAHAGVPVIDVRRYDAATIRAVGDALGEHGFVSIVGHGVDPALLARGFETAADLFALPPPVLAAYERPDIGRQRGYVPFRRESAVGGLAPDLKAFWHVGRDLPPEHPLVRRGLMPPNPWPAERPLFAPVMRAVYRELERVALAMLDALAVYLGADPRALRDMVRDGNSVLRIIDYPEVRDAEPGAVRAAAHEDINLLTVLPAATRPGLELLTRDGRWLPIESAPGALICDTGDMMQLLSGGRLPAVTHRVVNPVDADGGRRSMPFFLHPRPDARLGLPGPDGRTDGVLAHDFLLERLAANYRTPTDPARPR